MIRTQIRRKSHKKIIAHAVNRVNKQRGLEGLKKLTKITTKSGSSNLSEIVDDILYTT